MTYTILRKIGSGGFGEVFEATDQSGRRCAVKFARSGDPVSLEKLRSQFTYLARTHHQRIVRALDFDPQAPDGALMVTELVKGRDLRAYVARSGEDRLVEIVARVLDALRYLHSIGRIHGDLKPSSILVVEKGTEVDVKLIDAGFELARGGLPTLEGTPDYLAPEVIRNKTRDARSDLYSLGMTIYEVLTGDLPFRRGDTEAALSFHLESRPDLTTIQDKSTAWATFVEHLLCKEPNGRYTSAIEAGLALEKLHSMPGVFQKSVVLPYAGQLVGVDAEVDRLLEAITRSSNRVFAVEGPGRSGLSRLLDEVRIRLLEDGYRVHWLAAMRGRSLLHQILNIAEAAGEVFEAGAPLSRRDMIALAGDALSRIGSDGRSHVLIIDDADLSQQETHALVEVIVESLENIQVIVGTHDLQTWKSPLRVSREQKFGLRPLSLANARLMLQSLLGTVQIPDRLVDDLHRASHGYPGGIDMALRYLIDCDHVRLAMSDGSLVVTYDGKQVSPERERMVSECLSVLSENAKTILFALAAARGHLEEQSLRGVFGDSVVDSAIDELRNKGLIIDRLDGDSIGLVYGGMDETIRSIASPAALKEIGQNLGRFLERLPPTGWNSFRLGMVLWSIGERRKALTHLVQAGRHLAGYSPGDAIEAYETALECVTDVNEKARIHEYIGDVELASDEIDDAVTHFEIAAEVLLSARRKLGWTSALRGKVNEAIEILKTCQDEASSAGNLEEVAHSLADLGYVYVIATRLDEALKSLTRAAEVFAELGMTAEAGKALNRMGIAHTKAGNFRAALKAYSAARAAFEKAGDARRTALAAINEALCLRKQANLAEAQELVQKSIGVLEDRRAPYERAGSYQALALILLDLGKLESARKSAYHALEINRNVAIASGIISATLMVAAIELEQGSWQAALDRIDDLTRRNLNAYQLAIALRYRSRAKAMVGDLEAARDLADQSFELATQASDVEGKGQALIEKAIVLMKAGRFREAGEIASKARAILELAPSPIYSLVAQTVLGEALALSGKPDEGLAELLEACNAFADFPESLHLARVYRALASVYHLLGDKPSYWRHISSAIEVFSKAGARYDFTLAILDAGEVALGEGNFVKANRYLSEAVRTFDALGIDSLKQRAVEIMNKVRDRDVESSAIKSLSKISKILSSSQDLSSVLNAAMDLAVEYLSAERGVLLLIDEVTGELAPIVERRMDTQSIEDALDISRTIIEEVRSTAEPVVSCDAAKDPRFRESKSIVMHNIKAVMSLPLKVDEDLLGVIYLDSRSVPAAFSELERAFVDAFANQVALAIANARSFGKLHERCVDLRMRAGERYSFANIVGPGKRMQEIFRQVDKAAKSKITVLITGESGTGKELIAGLLHELSPRKDKPYVIVDLAAISKDLLETELFGIEKRVATGVAARAGVFERANGGTIFLDEIGDMPLETQMKVLRVLAEQEFTRVGGTKVIKVDVRVISATNKNLKELMEKGVFRQDLYYRLNAMQIHLPALRERLEDLPALVAYFLRKYAAQNAKPSMEIDPEAFEVLRSYWWPGNVRELEKCIEHAVVVAEGRLIGIEHLPREIVDSVRLAEAASKVRSSGHASLPEAVEALEKQMIMDALRRSGNVKTRAARLLGIHESTLRKKLKAYGIEV